MLVYVNESLANLYSTNENCTSMNILETRKTEAISKLGA